MQAVPSHHRWWSGKDFLVLRSLIKQRDNRDVFSKPTSRYSTSYCTIYPLFVSIPIYYSTPFGGVLFNYWCIYSFEVKLSGFTEEYWISITDPQDGTGSFSRLLKSFYMYGVMLLLHTRVLMIKTKVIKFMINTLSSTLKRKQENCPIYLVKCTAEQLRRDQWYV